MKRTLAIVVLAACFLGLAILHTSYKVACGNAIDAADTLITSSGQAMLLSSDALTAASEFDLPALTDVESEMSDLSPVMQDQADDYVEKKEQCP